MIAKTQKYSYIDSIRGYAVLMVLATHVFAFGGGNANQDIVLAKVWVQCRMGVMLFYIASALTLFLSYNQKIKIEKYPVGNFFVRRFFRIVPLFYLVCVYNLFFYKFNMTAIIGTLTFTNGFMPKYIHGIVSGGWSIAIESIFYLMVPLLFKYVSSIKRSVLFFVLSLILAVLARFIVFKYLINTYTNDTLLTWTLYWLPLQLPVFALGIYVYFLFFQVKFNLTGSKDFNKNFAYFLFLCAFYFFIIASYSAHLFIFESIAFSIVLMLFVTGMALHPDNILNNKVMQFFGKISYSFYLLHPIVISIIGSTQLNKISNIFGPTVGFCICFLLLLGLTTSISYISYRYIEQLFQKLGVGIIEKRETNR